MTDERQTDNPDSDTVSGSTERAFREMTAAVVVACGELQRWVHRRGRITQLVVGGIVAVLVERGFGAVVALLAAISPDMLLPSRGLLLAALLATVVGQSVLQVRKLFAIDNRLRSMGESTTIPDGGEEFARRPSELDSADRRGRADDRGVAGGGGAVADEEESTVEMNSTGAAGVTCAIAGIAIAAPYGVGAAVFAAVVGWIVGDELEERVLIPSM